MLKIEITRGGDFRREEADRLVALFADNFPEAFVVQIGANDGASGDPLVAAFARTCWSGLLVEPVPHLCSALAQRYAERPNVRVVQAAISLEDGDAALYRLREIPGQTPEWFSHLATLDREILLRHRASIPEIESLIVEERVPTLRLATLLRQHAIERIDLLVIDAEGYDFEILRQVDFT
ncbi:MAG: FkbM family methyltransferase, partial [Verrucomicrobiaceae bacterium]|nr:FkbM family methyltransferase [Verrucomicrobiaceae bacterium]